MAPRIAETAPLREATAYEAAVIAEAEAAFTSYRRRVWVSGHVALLPLAHRQVQPCADWTQSTLRYQVTEGSDPSPPPGYTGVTYDETHSDYPPSTYIDNHAYDQPIRPS